MYALYWIPDEIRLCMGYGKASSHSNRAESG